MMILLTILKIIGFVLLFLVLFLLFLFLLLLFFPVKYSVMASYQSDLQADIRVSWLFRSIQLRGRFIENNLSVWMKIFFLKKDFLDEDDYIADDHIEESIVKESATEETIANDTTTIKHEIADDTIKQKKKKKRPISIIEKAKSIIHNIWGMIKNIRTTIENILNLVKDKRHQEAFLHLKKEFFLLLKILMPKKLKLIAQFSTGSPDTTGIVLGVLAMFPIGYQNRWQITPDFTAEKGYLKGNMDVSGRFCLFRIVGILIRILLDKNCRRLYTHLTK